MEDTTSLSVSVSKKRTLEEVEDNQLGKTQKIEEQDVFIAPKPPTVDLTIEDTPQTHQTPEKPPAIHNIFSILRESPTAQRQKTPKKMNANAPEFIPFSFKSVQEKPVEKAQKPKKKYAPWIKGRHPKTLDEEIDMFVKYIEPTKEERVVRADLFDRLSTVIKEKWPQCEVIVFGSYVSDLFLPYSDMDIVVVDAPGQRSLHALAKIIRDKGMCTNIHVIDAARVPIIKMTDSFSGVTVDISFNQSNGPANTKVIQSFMKEIPLLKPMALVLKYFLQQRGLNEPYTGGIGSYALVILIINFLQMYTINAQSEEKPSLATLITDFFEFFGAKFNFFTTGITIRNGGGYFRKDDRKWFQPQRAANLCIEDPQDISNDVSKGTYNVPNLRIAFLNAYHCLCAKDLSFATSPLGRILNIEKACEMEEYRQSLKSLVNEL